MREETETVYICDYCEEAYAKKEDCLDCEVACKIFNPTEGISDSFDSCVESLNPVEKVKIAKAIIESFQCQ